jgi:hypothetical protein
MTFTPKTFSKESNMSSIVKISHEGNKTDALLFEQVQYEGPDETEKHYRVLEATFKIHYQGMHHVTGITYSIDGWKTRSDSYASFKSTIAEPGGYVEIWKANLSIPCIQDSAQKWNGIEKIEYIIWCEDYHTLDGVKKIYKTSNANGGEPFAAVFTGAINQPARKPVTTVKTAIHTESNKVETGKVESNKPETVKNLEKPETPRDPVKESQPAGSKKQLILQ